MFAALFQQDLRTQHICTYEYLRSCYGAINMGFSGKVNNRINILLSQQTGHQGGIANVTLYKFVPRVMLYSFKITQVTGIGQRIQVGNATSGIVGDKGVNEVGSDKTGSTGNKKRFWSKHPLLFLFHADLFKDTNFSFIIFLDIM